MFGAKTRLDSATCSICRVCARRFCSNLCVVYSLCNMV